VVQLSGARLRFFKKKRVLWKCQFEWELAIKYNDKDDEIFRNLYLNLDTTIAHPLDEDTMKEFAPTFRQVNHYMIDRPCQQCGDIACSEKINNTYSLVVAKTSGFIGEDRRYADSWDDIFNNQFFLVSIFISFTKT
jgi:hypothetical protein